MFRSVTLTHDFFARLGLLCLCLGLIAGLLGCEGQQNANKAAYAVAEAAVQADEKYLKVFDRMEYQREHIRVYVKPGPDTLPEEKGAVVQYIAQVMGDTLKANPDNKLKELIVFGNLEDEELWQFRYDMADGKVYTEKSRLTTTM